MKKSASENTILQMLLIAASACLIYGLGSGIRSNYGIMLMAISDNSGVEYASVSFVVATAQLMYGVMQPIAGIVANKKSNAFVLCLGAALLGTGLIAIPFCHSMLSLMLALGVVAAVGTGALSFGVIMGAVTPILGEKRAAAVSFLIEERHM